MPSHSAPITDGVPPEIAAELVARVATLQETQRAEDVDGFLALFDPEATWVTGGGQRLVGLDAIAAFTRQVLPGAFAAGSVRYDVQLVRLLGPTIAVTGVASTYVDDDDTPTSRGLPTYVWRREGDEWRIVVGQNTAAAT
jgi:uncharacterized protein (TIGR02246 family)